MTINHFQIQCGHADSSELLSWINEQIPVHHLKVKNFSTDWCDGVALCALVNSIRPDLCPDFATLDRRQKENNCSLGIRLAESELGIARLIEPEELCKPDIDGRSVVTYISCFVKPILLRWIRDLLPDREIKNLDSDWKNGVNLACLSNVLVPGSLPNCKELDPQNAHYNLQKAMEVIKARLGVELPFSPTDEQNDMLVMIRYLSRINYISHIRRDIVCTGHGLVKAFKGRPSSFEIDARARPDAEVKDFTVTLTDSKNSTVRPEITPNGKGCFNVKYTPWSAGDLKIEIKWKDVIIPLTHANIDVIDAIFTVKERCIKVSSSVVVEVQGIKDTDELDISLCDMNGETVSKDQDSIRKASNDGITSCSVKATKIGKTKVIVKISGIEVPESPFEIDVVDPQCFKLQQLEPTSGERLAVNKPASFCITKLDSDGNFKCLLAKVKAPGDAKAKDIALAQQGESMVCKFTPDKGGVYEIAVTCAGEDVCSSPIKLNVSDSRCCTFHPGLPQYLQLKEDVPVPHKVKLSTRGAGQGEIKVYSSHEDVLTVSIESNEAEKDSYTIKFIPKQVGESKIEVKFDGILVPKTPHNVIVCDASKCTASGEVLTTRHTKTNEQFQIDVAVPTKEAGNGKLEAKFVHGTKTACTPNMEFDTDGIHHITLMSYEAGMHTLSILWGGADIPGSPYKIKVSCDALRFSASGDGLKEAIARRTTKFQLKGPQAGLVKEDMLKVQIRGNQVESEMVDRDKFDPSSEKALVCATDEQKGSYSIMYSVPSQGKYTIDIKIDEKPILDNPFNITVQPAFDPLKCKTYGPAIDNADSIVLGKSIEFKVDTTDAGTGEIDVITTDPSLKRLPVTLTKDISHYTKKIHAVKFDPNMIGKHSVDINWRKEPILNSPFTFNVCDPRKVKVLNLPDPSTHVAEVNKPFVFSVDSKDAGACKFDCTINTVNTKDHQIHEPQIKIEPKPEDDGTCSFTYTPKEVGKMEVILTCCGETILPSKWECEVVDPIITKVSLLSNLRTKLGESVKFSVSGLPSNTVERLTLSVIDPNNKAMPFTLERQHEGIGVYHFMPEQVGPYMVIAKVDSKDIQGSPINMNIVNPGACTIKGEIPKAVYLQNPQQFHIDTSKVGPGEFTFETESPVGSTPKLNCKFDSNDPNSTLVELSGIEHGVCKLTIKCCGYDLPEMPITIYDPKRCTVECKQLEAGNVKTTDKVVLLVNTSEAGSCEPTATAQGPTDEYHVETEEIGDGEYKLSFTPHQSGHQTVQVSIGGVLLDDHKITFETVEIDDAQNVSEDITGPDGDEESSEDETDQIENTEDIDQNDQHKEITDEGNIPVEGTESTVQSGASGNSTKTSIGFSGTCKKCSSFCKSCCLYITEFLIKLFLTLLICGIIFYGYAVDYPPIRPI